MAHSIGVSKVRRPPHIVPIQLKNLMPVGTAIANEARLKNGRLTAPVVNMWWAQTVIERLAMAIVARTNAEVSEDRLPAEDRDDLGDDAEERQDEDVDLRVAEEPEQVLPQNGVAAGGGVEEGPAESPVDEEHGQRRRQDREREEDQQRGHEDVPGEDRHPEHAHPGRPHRVDRDDEVDGAEHARDADERQPDDPQVERRRRAPRSGR